MKINSHQQTANQINLEVKSLKKIQTKSKCNIFILRNYTAENISSLIEYYLLKSYIKPQISFGNYNNIIEEICDKNSALYQIDPDIVVISIDIFQFLEDSSSLENFKETAKSFINQLSSEVILLKKTIIINTLFQPYYLQFSYKNSSENLSYFIQNINHKIHELSIHNDHIYLCDFIRYQSLLGQSQSIDSRFQYLSRAPYSTHFFNEYAYDISNIIKSLKGQLIKAIILDADNTLWGGILGEDLPENLKIGPFKYPDTCYYQFQKLLLALKDKGILITICSKNNQKDLLDFINSCNDCLIKEKDLAYYQINWNAKYKNIINIKNFLNIGYDSLLFIDDNQREIEEINQFLPEVKTILIPQNPTEIPNLLLHENLTSISSIKIHENKTLQYQSELARKQSENQYQNYDEYIKSLGIELIIEEIAIRSIPRVSEMTLKTNQFNLTTMRLDAIGVKEFLSNTNSKIFTLFVKDKFGDSGLTGAIFIKINEKIIIENYLLSCRILGKKIEIAFLYDVLKKLYHQGHKKTIEAHYIESKKNEQVKNFYLKLGFTPIKKNDTTTITWQLKNLNEIKITKESLWKIK